MNAEHPAPVIDANLADPFVVRSDRAYFLYASLEASDGRYLPVYRSSNLRDWTFLRGAVERGEEGAWNRYNFWAPEVLYREDRYWLYYTAMPEDDPKHHGNRLGAAVADVPEGPFEDIGVVVRHASIDGSPFVDHDGAMYMYYTSEHGNVDGLPAGRIYVDRMPDPGRVEGNPKELIGWHPWQEGPCVLYRFGRYYLFYSLGEWGATGTYHVMWGVSDSPLGPFTEQPDRLLVGTDTVRGPGHNNFFQDDQGADWTCYHGWDPACTARYPRLGRIGWEKEQPVFLG